MDMTNYTAGFSRLDVTPPLGIPMKGAWQPKAAVGVLDPLYVNAVAFGDGENAAVLLVLDSLGLYESFCDSWPAQIAEHVGLPADSIIIHCTHTHTAPDLAEDEMYASWLLRRLKDAAFMALSDRKPVADVRWTEDQAKGMAFVRRYRLNNGTVITNPAGHYLDMLVGPACETDESMRLIRILRQDAPEIVMVNFQSHPDNVSGDKYSADYPGYFRNKLEQLRENIHCVFLEGCQGQMVIEGRGKDVVRQAAGFEKASQYGYRLAEVASRLFDRTVSTGTVGLTFGKKAVRLLTKWEPSRMSEAQRILQLHDEGRDPEIHPEQKIANYILAEARQLKKLDAEKNAYCDTYACGITFCGLAFVGLPGEPFNEIGKQVRKNSKFPVTCVLCQSNGAVGYIPTAEAHDQGGYEAYNTPYRKGTAELLADTADALLASL